MRLIVERSDGEIFDVIAMFDGEKETKDRLRACAATVRDGEDYCAIEIPYPDCIKVVH